jgi:DNA-binding MarR family transcriptional regulator/N-acetylglutamate synthase-like GNAT family acetyltransferase
MSEDVITQLRELALASRLKRLSERLMRDVSGIYDELSVVFKARWFPVLYALGQESPRSVTELAQTLRLTHPAINQIVTEMVRRGLLLRSRDAVDERKRLLSLTAKGEDTIRRLEPVWEEIRIANAEFMDEVGVDLLDVLGRIEAGLDRRGMYERVRERLDLPPRGEVEIVGYRPAYKKHFRALNEEWLRRYFGIEEEDERLLADPNRRIVRKGGAILFARLENEIVGTCALLRRPGAEFELAKMAVTERHQGRGIGRQLALAAIEHARRSGARAIVLMTSPELERACALYRKLGFREVDGYAVEKGKYCRCSIAMRLDLPPPASTSGPAVD